ncbi:uncharacterized protein [Sinocyclocheilus grahami]|uniref:uncharacterized protein n=1 Tax=Sinocyclocheilus grahami TaxID=75366 RepID=UPI0007AD385A|nr:PREDICTED: uncharacterized protein LOC107571442 [Sinocyclocheilus grahami]
MVRGLQWASGRLIEVDTAEEMMAVVQEFLQEIHDIEHNQPSSEDAHSYQSPFLRSGGVGRPRLDISVDQLNFLLSLNFTARQAGDILGVSYSTIKNRQFSISLKGQYSRISNAQLDEQIRELVGVNYELGPEAVRARLYAEGFVIQRRRVRASMQRIDPEEAAYRAMTHRFQRRVYHVAGPNSLWHIDGNHKLIRWRVVVHGGIDGFRRLVVFLQASNNNRSATVMDQFVNATVQYGVPSRVRCDHGGENNAVCLFMEVCRGSAMRGRSTHNQKIERLWGDVWRGTINVYHSLFTLLEQDGMIDPINEKHMWAVHYVYLPRLNRD